MRRFVLIAFCIIGGCAGAPTGAPVPAELGRAARASEPGSCPGISTAWLRGSGGFAGRECLSVWVDAGGGASVRSLGADENSFRLAPDLHAALMADLAALWDLGGPAGADAPGEDLIAYTLLITGTDGSTRSFRYRDGAPKAPALARAHRRLLAVINGAGP